MTEVRVLTNCVVGLGFSWRSFQAGLAEEPHLIGADAGTADMGPARLGAGADGPVSPAVRRDLDIMLHGARTHEVPFAIGTAGHAGGEPHLQATWKVVQEIAAERGHHFRAALIHAELDKQFLKDRLKSGRITPHGHGRELSADDIDRSARVVGMICGRPFERAWDLGAEVVIAGRTADPAIFAPFMMREGVPPGIAWHAAKTIDKGHNATTDWWDGSSVMAYVSEDEFVVRPMKESSRCTVASVAAMTMYEHANPYEYVVSEGSLDTSACTFEQIDDRSVRVARARFTPADRYTIKLEGSAPVGYRSIVVGGLRDPLLIDALPSIVERTPDMVNRFMRSAGIDGADYTIRFRPYGLGAVMGPLEPDDAMAPPEACLIIEVIGRTQHIANAVASKASSLVSHANYPRKLSRNLAYPFSPTVIPVGQVFEWSVWHILDADDDDVDQLLPVEVVEV